MFGFSNIHSTHFRHSLIVGLLLISGAGCTPPKQIKPTIIPNVSPPILEQTPHNETSTPQIKQDVPKKQINIPEQKINAVPPPPTTSPVVAQTKPIAIQATIPVTLEIASTTLKIDIPEKTNAYDLMALAKEKNYLTFSEQKYGSLGYMITEINGIKNSTRDQKFWIYYINGQKAKIGVSNYILYSHDIITWKYEDQE